MTKVIGKKNRFSDKMRIFRVVKDKYDLWTDIDKKGEVIPCVKCSTRIWKKWMHEREDMTICGPCYFKEVAKYV